MKRNQLSGFWPILSLYILSPVIAELLMGSTPVSRGQQLILESLYYGSAAVLIREIVRRRNLGWASIITLGIVFGIAEECLTLQSVFNPGFLGNNLTYGRAFGVNWIWAMCIIGYHAVWSISIPVFFAETLFRSVKMKTWLNTAGIWIIAGIFILSSVFFFEIFYSMSQYTASYLHFIIAAVIAIAFVAVSLRLPAIVQVNVIFKNIPPFYSGVISFIAAALWLGVLMLVFKPGMGVPPLLAAAFALLIVSGIAYYAFSRPEDIRVNKNHFSLAAGSLYASMLFGLMTVSVNKTDFIFQICFIVIVSFLLFIVYRKYLK